MRLVGVIQTSSRRPQAISFEIVAADLKPMWEDLHNASGGYEVDECTESIFWRFRAGVWRTLFARNQIGSLRFEPFGMGEDMLFSLTFFAGMTYWTLLDEALYFYRKRQGSACHSPIKRAVVSDWLSVQGRLIDALLVSRRLFVLGGGIAQHYLPWWGGQLYYTSGEMIFKLRACEMRQCYAQWVELLVRFSAFCPYPRYKRFIIKRLRQVQSPFLARLLVYWPLLVRRALSLAQVF